MTTSEGPTGDQSMIGVDSCLTSAEKGEAVKVCWCAGRAPICMDGMMKPCSPDRMYLDSACSCKRDRGTDPRPYLFSLRPGKLRIVFRSLHYAIPALLSMLHCQIRPRSASMPRITTNPLFHTKSRRQPVLSGWKRASCLQHSHLRSPPGIRGLVSRLTPPSAAH